MTTMRHDRPTAGACCKRADRKRSTFCGLDPGILLLAAAGAAFCFSCIRDFSLSCLCLAFAAVLALIGRISAPVLLKHLASVNVFVIFLWLTVPLSMPGEPCLELGFLRWTREGIGLAAAVTVKCNAIALSFAALASGIAPSMAGSALARAHIPAKLTFLFLFTWRYVHVIGEEWRRLRVAAHLRGFVPRTSLHTYGTIGNMLGLTIVNAIDRSRRIYEAMALRGFTGTYRTLAEPKAAAADMLFAALFFSALACLLFLDFRLK